MKEGNNSHFKKNKHKCPTRSLFFFSPYGTKAFQYWEKANKDVHPQSTNEKPLKLGEERGDKTSASGGGRGIQASARPTTGGGVGALIKSSLRHRNIMPA